MLALASPVNAQKQLRSKVNKATAKSVTPPCDLTIKDAPKLRGFYLGQSYQEIAQMIPKFEQFYLLAGQKNLRFKGTDVDEKGVSSTEIWSSYFPNLNDPNLADLIKKVDEESGIDNESQISWGFYNGKLYHLFVEYTKFEPNTIRDLIAQVAEKTGLPGASFKIKDKYKADLRCQGFTVSLDMGIYTRFEGYVKQSPEIFVEDTETALRLDKLYQDIERKKKEDALLKRKEELRQRQDEQKKKKIFKP